MEDDYRALSGGEFGQFYTFMCRYVNTKCTGSTPEWAHIPAAARTVRNDGYAGWYTACAKTIGPQFEASFFALFAVVVNFLVSVGQV
jgi:hypothetical protein